MLKSVLCIKCGLICICRKWSSVILFQVLFFLYIISKEAIFMTKFSQASAIHLVSAKPFLGKATLKFPFWACTITVYTSVRGRETAAAIQEEVKNADNAYQKCNQEDRSFNSVQGLQNGGHLYLLNYNPGGSICWILGKKVGYSWFFYCCRVFIPKQFIEYRHFVKIVSDHGFYCMGYNLSVCIYKIDISIVWSQILIGIV